MKKSLVNFLRGVLVVVMLLKLTFIFDIPQKGTFAIFALEMNEVESEESQKSNPDGDEFIKLSFNWGYSYQSFSSDPGIFFILNIEAHIREIVPPPPQV